MCCLCKRTLCFTLAASFVTDSKLNFTVVSSSQGVYTWNGHGPPSHLCHMNQIMPSLVFHVSVYCTAHHCDCKMEDHQKTSGYST